jgi:hypothetical protein
MATVKSIGRFTPEDPKTHPKDWILCKDESPGGDKFILPYGTRVNLTRTENERDYFEILDYRELRGKSASLSFATVNGKKEPRLIAPPTYAGPAKVLWDAAAGKVTVKSANGSTVIAAATSQPQVPNGTYKIWPKVPGKAFQHAAGFVDRAPHALSWWIIDYQISEGYCFHTGNNSLGCVTVTEHAKWESIFAILILARTADGLYSGEISVKGHELIA